VAFVVGQSVSVLAAIADAEMAAGKPAIKRYMRDERDAVRDALIARSQRRIGSRVAARRVFRRVW